LSFFSGYIEKLPVGRNLLPSGFVCFDVPPQPGSELVAAGAQQGQYYDADYKVVDDDENNKK
jgi:hypothetical protein